MKHELMLALIIIGMGLFSGVTVFLDYKTKNKASTIHKHEIWKFITSSIGASALVPLLLNMLSSDLIKINSTEFETNNYFIFSGFCFIAGYFSNKFINTIGDRILKDVENSKRIAEDALEEVQKTTEKIDVIVSNDSEFSELIEPNSINLDNVRDNPLYVNEDVDSLMDDVLNSLNGKFKFRTVMGIATEVGKNIELIKLVLHSFERFSAVSKIKDDHDKELWALTGIGKSLIEQRKAGQQSNL